MNCPRCKAQLRSVNYEGIRIETCDSCHGEWLDNTELKKVIDRREVAFDLEKRKAFADSIKSQRVDLSGDQQKLVCPKCNGETRPINYSEDSGIIIDRCNECKGIWLDRGELEAIQMFVEGVQDLLAGDLKKWSSKLDEVNGEVEQKEAGTGGRFRSGFSQLLGWFG